MTQRIEPVRLKGVESATIQYARNFDKTYFQDPSVMSRGSMLEGPMRSVRAFCQGRDLLGRGNIPKFHAERAMFQIQTRNEYSTVALLCPKFSASPGNAVARVGGLRRD